jgi:hypothetical protein
VCHASWPAYLKYRFAQLGSGRGTAAAMRSRSARSCTHALLGRGSGPQSWLLDCCRQCVEVPGLNVKFKRHCKTRNTALQ